MARLVTSSAWKQGRHLQGILGNIAQTFDSHELYPNVEEKAAHLLYFVIKDHPFTDGNQKDQELFWPKNGRFPGRQQAAGAVRHK